MVAPLAEVIDLVVHNGMDRDRAELIAEYIADRCAGLTLTSAHSSAHSSLRLDAFLLRQMELRPRQIGAWLALIRGTRAVRNCDGRPVGGFAGLVEALSRGPLSDADRRRFERLAYVAASGCLRPPCRASAADRPVSGGR